VTPTPELQAAIEAEARRAPAVPRSELVVRLALRGARATDHDRAARRARRRQALHETRGTFAYPDGYLDDLREDWDR